MTTRPFVSLALITALSLGCAGPAGGGGPAGLHDCEVVVPDEEIHCPYHPLRDGDDLAYLELSDGTIRTASLARPDDPEGAVLLDPFPALGWSPGVTTISPDGERALTARAKSGCESLDCSFGRLTLWLAQHVPNDPDDPDDDIWMHVNLTRRGLGRNSEIHGWTTWLHEDMALFNALARDDAAGWGMTQEENTTQMYAVRFDAEGPHVEAFAPARMWRDACLTGRISAQPSSGGCFDGQRVTIVRRCYDEPHTPEAWAWWNTAQADGSGGPCVASLPSFEVPVLRTYVVELDASCAPTRDFEDLVPVRAPPDGPVQRQMGITPEWGDMLSAISPDGRWVGVATNMGDPATPTDNCAGFHLNLTDPSSPTSGNATRRTTICELDDTRRCIDPAGELVEAESTPPEGTPLPTFALLPSGQMTVACTREWGVAGMPMLRDIERIDFQLGPGARVPLAFGRHALGAQAIYRR
jgi:hypothetical protein